MTKDLLLIVEDDQSIADLLREILRPISRHVHVAYTQAQAMKRLEHFNYSLVLLDFYLDGGLTGAPIAEWLNARHMPFILITAGQGPERIAENVKAPFWLSKPFNVEDLESTVTQVLDRRVRA